MGPAVAAGTCFLVLLIAGLSHLRHVQSFESQLVAQDLWPAAHVRRLAWLVAASELLLGALGLLLTVGVSSHSGPGDAWSVLAALAVIAYSLFGVYGMFLLRTRPDAPCACGSHAERTRPVTVARALVLAGAGGWAAAAGPPADGLAFKEGFVGIIAVVVFAVLALTLPVATEDPLYVERVELP